MISSVSAVGIDSFFVETAWAFRFGCGLFLIALCNPKERATIVGFEKRFVAVPIRNKGLGAIVSALV